MRVHAIQTGEVQIKSRHVQPRHEHRAARLLDVIADRSWEPPLPILCWAIEHPEGLVIVDTGETSHINDPGYLPRWDLFSRTSARFTVPGGQEAADRLRALGLDAADVRWVVMTHMHGDHAGGLRHFAGSEIVMSEREAAMALSRTARLAGYPRRHYPAWLDPRRVRFEGDPWESFASSVALTSDGAIRLLPTPGHTDGHLSVAVETGDAVVLLAGDAAYSEHALLEGIVDGVAQSARDHRDSTARLRALCGRRKVVFLPAHDPESSRRLQEGAATVVTGLA